MTAVLESVHPAMAGVKLELKNAPLWKQFHSNVTEMIITKSGRRMFPSLRLSLSGLDPEARYFLILEARLSEGRRYKFGGGTWSGVGPADPQPHPSTRVYVHPDSPAPGSAWMAQDILFQKAKLTNNTLDRSGNLVLTSMHKYQPRIHVVKASDILAVDWSPSATFTFPETEFVAVTAYQNEKITELKIDYNPFAKAFRENGMAKTKRKIQAKQRAEETDEKQEKEENQPEEKKSCSGGGKSEDDSGVSVGSVTPPIEERLSRLQSDLQLPCRSDLQLLPGGRLRPDLPPPPPFYPAAYWPFPPFFPAYPAFFPAYPPSFYPHPPIFDLHPADFSLKP